MALKLWRNFFCDCGIALIFLEIALIFLEIALGNSGIALI